MSEKRIEKLEPDFEKSGGLMPAVAQDAVSGEILMLAYMNRESYEKTLSTGKVHYYSRSRQELWLKGRTSGHFQLVKELYLDCDQDAIVVKIEQIGGVACHTGKRSCFHFKHISGSDYEVIED
ncbi:MAG: phosphoribosyl-AMP cyclohydrolase [Deltaproteobacteria bacterium]|jgi:phosphoribosyl-AMP cyclohydrolase|nr:phosphoribosyl-AMP cyclohydrolase [Deltaproteobacteria bacterium]